MKILFVVPCRNLVASGQVRVLSFLPRLRQLGFEVEVIDFHHPTQILLPLFRRRHLVDSGFRSNLELMIMRVLHRARCRPYLRQFPRKVLNAARWADAIFVQWVQLDPAILDGLAASECRLIYDFDDAVYLTNSAGFHAMLEHAWCVVSGSAAGVREAQRTHSRVVQVPSTVDVEQFDKATSGRPDGRFVTLGWIGGHSTVEYLKLVAAPIRALNRDSAPIRLLLAGTGYSDAIPDFGSTPVELVHCYSHAEIPALAASIDIGLMPLHDTEWADGKCAMKFLVYGAARRPCVASRVGEVTRIADDGTEVLLAQTEAEWQRNLEFLIASKETRSAIGQAAQKLVKRDYSSAVGFELLCQNVFDPLRDQLAAR